MVNNCTNPKCNKPLHYLREGRVFVFDVASAQIGPDGKRVKHLQHYWLCGDCAPKFSVTHSSEEGVTLHPKLPQQKIGVTTVPTVLAS